MVNFSNECKKTTFYHKKPSKIERKEGYEHPTQKPVSLIQELIETFCYKDGIVLDCFCGSGTTGVACTITNNNFIGIDKSDIWCNISENRIIRNTIL